MKNRPEVWRCGREINIFAFVIKFIPIHFQYIYIYIYIYECVCVCVCVLIEGLAIWQPELRYLMPYFRFFFFVSMWHRAILRVFPGHHITALLYDMTHFLLTSKCNTLGGIRVLPDIYDDDLDPIPV